MQCMYIIKEKKSSEYTYTLVRPRMREAHYRRDTEGVGTDDKGQLPLHAVGYYSK
jgi:hypothetical protein